MGAKSKADSPTTSALLDVTPLLAEDLALYHTTARTFFLEETSD